MAASRPVTGGRPLRAPSLYLRPDRRFLPTGPVWGVELNTYVGILLGRNFIGECLKKSCSRDSRLQLPCQPGVDAASRFDASKT
eukprot:266168-Prorocentrum_minimum.AAC.1